MISGRSLAWHKDIEYPFLATDIAYIIDNLRREELDRLAAMFRAVGVRRPETKGSMRTLLINFGIQYSPTMDKPFAESEDQE